MTMLDVPLFDVPRSEWRLRACPVCGGALSVTHAYTYVMQRQGWVKIGSSGNVAERLSVLRRATPGCLVRAPRDMDWSQPLVLLRVIDGAAEHELHERFASSHAYGEWFLPDTEMKNWLAA